MGAPAGNPPVGYGQAPRPAYQPGQNQPNNYQGSGQYQGAAQAPPPPSGPVTLSAGLLLPIRTSEPLDSKKMKPGDYFQGTVAQNIYSGNVLAIPRGAAVTGQVVDVKKPGELKGGASMTLRITSLNLGGNSYSLATDVFNTSSPGKGGYTAGNTVGAAALGAVIGAVAGGGPGAAIGAVAGTGVGLGASAATPGPRSVVPPEAVLSFHLTSPATVQPVSYQEAARMEAESGPPQGQGRYPWSLTVTAILVRQQRMRRRPQDMLRIPMLTATRIPARMSMRTPGLMCTVTRTTTAAGGSKQGKAKSVHGGAKSPAICIALYLKGRFIKVAITQ